MVKLQTVTNHRAPEFRAESKARVSSRPPVAELRRARKLLLTRPRLRAGTRMLVPITSSLYVPGETTPVETVLIDVGTGYFIEKSVPEAQGFLDRKIDLIKQQAVTVQQAMGIKNQNLEGVLQIMNQKSGGGAPAS